jgi:epoxide hydrolase
MSAWVVFPLLAVTIVAVGRWLRNKLQAEAGSSGKGDAAGVEGGIKKDARLRSRRATANELTEAEVSEVYDLFVQFFEKEFSSRDDFAAYLRGEAREEENDAPESSEKTLLLFSPRFEDSDSKQTIVGFIILQVGERGVPFSGQERRVGVVIGDYFALGNAYRARPEPLLALLEVCVKYWLFHCLWHRIPCFYFFVTYSYRSYLSFGRAIETFWPCHRRATPPFAKAILDNLGREAAGDWGDYDERRSVIVDRYGGSRGRLRLASSLGPVGDGTTSLAQSLQFFLDVNPGFREGDCFCVCCPVTLGNVISNIRKSFRRARSSPARRKMTAESTATEEMNPPRERNVAFGRTRQIGLPDAASVDIRPHFVRFDEAGRDDLKTRLRRTRHLRRTLLPVPGEFTCNFGPDSNYLQEVVRYWAEEFDFSASESRMNLLPQYTVQIDGVQLMFAHQPSSSEEPAIPLLLLHGFPSCSFEYFAVGDVLSNPSIGEVGFDVVIPCLPGHAWSSWPDETQHDEPFDVKAIARVLCKLMETLGYSRYAVHGGDWGASIASYLALVDPERCLGVHLTMPLADCVFEFGDLPFGRKVRLVKDYLSATLWYGLSPFEQSGLDDLERIGETEVAYIDLQATKPLALAPALSDSPVGLLAWMLDKFVAWGECSDGPDLEARLAASNSLQSGRDVLLDIVTAYWMTNCSASAFKLYHNSKATGRFGPPESRVECPVAVCLFPGELVRVPRRWAERHYNIVRWTEQTSGGHFAGLEAPRALASDIRDFVTNCVVDAVPA